jgi:hypothetical protein
MPQVAITFGFALILFGLAGFVSAGFRFLSVLAPAVFGALLAYLGKMALDPAKRKHAMHGAAFTGVLGFLWGMPKMAGLGVLLGGGKLTYPVVLFAHLAMAALMFVFVLLCVGSFSKARRDQRLAAESRQP